MNNPKTLTWENITVEINVQGKPLKILQNVSGKAVAGRMNIFMGPSGAGKSTLINTLMGHVPFNFKTSGKVFIDDKERPYGFKKIVGFSDQQDTYFDFYTAEQFLLFHSKGKNRDLALKESKERIKYLLRRMRLEKKKDTLVSKLSGGERKRLILISELMTNKKIIFLDEPTSGLDSHLALGLIRFLKELTIKENLLMFITLHQPSPTIVNLFDDFTFISWGKVLYHGEYSKCEDYFLKNGFVKPSNITFTEYIFELTAEEEKLFEEIQIDYKKLYALLPPDADSPRRSAQSFYISDYKMSFSVISAIITREFTYYFKNIGFHSILMTILFYILYVIGGFYLIREIKEYFSKYPLISSNFINYFIFTQSFYICYSFSAGLMIQRNINSILKNRQLLISEVKNNSYTPIELLISLFIMSIILIFFSFWIFLVPFAFYNLNFYFIGCLYYLPYALILSFVSTIFVFAIPVFSNVVLVICNSYLGTFSVFNSLIERAFNHNLLTKDNSKFIVQLLGMIFVFFPHNAYTLLTFKYFVELFFKNNELKGKDAEIKNFLSKMTFKKNLNLLSGIYFENDIDNWKIGLGFGLSLFIFLLFVWNSFRYIKVYTSLPYRYKLQS